MKPRQARFCRLYINCSSAMCASRAVKTGIISRIRTYDCPNGTLSHLPIVLSSFPTCHLIASPESRISEKHTTRVGSPTHSSLISFRTEKQGQSVTTIIFFRVLRHVRFVLPPSCRGHLIFLLTVWFGDVLPAFMTGYHQTWRSCRSCQEKRLSYTEEPRSEQEQSKPSMQIASRATKSDRPENFVRLLLPFWLAWLPFCIPHLFTSYQYRYLNLFTPSWTASTPSVCDLAVCSTTFAQFS